MPPIVSSPWFVFGALIGISLLATVASLLLHRTFGTHQVIMAIGPLLAVMGVLIYLFGAQGDWKMTRTAQANPTGPDKCCSHIP